MGDWLFGCDICQAVCPWNRKAPATDEPAFLPRPELTELDASDLLAISEEEFDQRFSRTALSRPGRAGLVRNAAIVAGNSGEARAIPALQAAANDADPLVCEAAQWALGRCSGPSIRKCQASEARSELQRFQR
jgi:epoxyqueuosine reductase